MSDATAIVPNPPDMPPSPAGLTNKPGPKLMSTDGQPTAAEFSIPPMPTAAPLVDRLTPRQIKSRAETRFRDGKAPEVVQVPVLVSRKQLPRTSPEKRLTAKIFKVLDAIQQDSKELLRGRWNDKRLQAANELFGMLDTPLTAKICLVWAFSHLRPLEDALQISRDALDETVMSGRSDLAATASMLQAQAKLIKEHRDTLDQIMDFAEKAQEKEKKRPRNLPPTIALQVNVPGSAPPPSPAPGTTFTLPATNGSADDSKT